MDRHEADQGNRRTVETLTRHVSRILTGVITAAIAVVIIGTAVIPAAAAYSYGNWRILLLYPVILILGVFLMSLAPPKR